jgi:O-antigen/teichoic acid export membrane protein
MSITDTMAQESKPRLAVQAMWLLVARTVAFVIALVMPIVVARVFDQQNLGLYRLALTVSNTVSAILPFGVGVSAFYFLPRLSEDRRKALIFNIVAYHVVVCTIAVVVLAVWPRLLSLLVTNSDPVGAARLVSLAPLIGLSIALIIFSGFFDNAATANQDVRLSTLFIVSAQASRAALIVGAAVVFRTVESLLYAWILQGFLQSCALIWYLHYRFPAFWKFRNRSLFNEQMNYVLPLGFTSLMIVVQLELHNYFVTSHFTTAQFAIYAVGTAQVPLIGIVRDSINSVMQARMSKLQHDNDPTTMLHLMLRSWRILGMVFIPVFAGLMVLAEDFITGLYKVRYIESVPIMRLYLFLLLTSIFITDAVIRSYADYRFWFLKNRLLLLAIQIALSFALVPIIGMSGALMAMVITMVIDRVLNLRIVFRLLGFSREHLYIFRDFGTLFMLAGIASAITFATVSLLPGAHPLIRLFAGISIFGISYIVAVLASGFLNSEEKDFVKKSSARVVRFVRPSLATRIDQW